MLVYIILFLIIGFLIVQSIRYEQVIRHLWKLCNITGDVALGASRIACDNAEEINEHRVDIDLLKDKVFRLENDN